VLPGAHLAVQLADEHALAGAHAAVSLPELGDGAPRGGANPGQDGGDGGGGAQVGQGTGVGGREDGGRPQGRGGGGEQSGAHWQQSHGSPLR